jgi:hypothetical protein
MAVNAIGVHGETTDLSKTTDKLYHIIVYKVDLIDDR